MSDAPGSGAQSTAESHARYRVAEERDWLFWSLMDGTYALHLRAMPLGLRLVNGVTPTWSSGWGRVSGHRANFASQLPIPYGRATVGLRRAEGTTVSRMVTLDVSKGSVWFERHDM